MPVKTFFTDACAPRPSGAEKPNLGSDPTAKPEAAIPGNVRPVDLPDGKSLWHGPKGGR